MTDFLTKEDLRLWCLTVKIMAMLVRQIAANSLPVHKDLQHESDQFIQDRNSVVLRSGTYAMLLEALFLLYIYVAHCYIIGFCYLSDIFAYPCSIISGLFVTVFSIFYHDLILIYVEYLNNPFPPPFLV